MTSIGGLLKRLLASVGRRAVVTVLVLLSMAQAARASDPCDRLLRQWIEEGKAAHLTEAQYNAPLERLAQLQQAGGEQVVAAVDAVFKAAEPGLAPRMMEQFLEKRTPEQARKIFDLGAAFADPNARKGLGMAAGLGPFQGVETGASVYEFARKTVVPMGAKEQFFRSLRAIAEHDGAGRLLRRAGVANDYGAVFEVAADAKLAETGAYGRLTGVDFDVSGQNTAFHMVDTTTETSDGARYAFQSKSSYNQQRKLVLDSDISAEDLEDLRQQARDLGARPVLISNVGFEQPLIDVCLEKDIIMEPSWVRVAE